MTIKYTLVTQNIHDGKEFPKFKGSSACLLISKSTISQNYLTKIIINLIDAGCTFFLTHGSVADQLEECIDDILVENNITNAITTSHQNESPKETINFMVNSTFPDEKNIRLILLTDERYSKEEIQNFLSTIKSEISHT